MKATSILGEMHQFCLFSSFNRLPYRFSRFIGKFIHFSSFSLSAPAPISFMLAHIIFGIDFLDALC